MSPRVDNPTDAGVGRQVPIVSRRRALALLGAVPIAVALGAALPVPPVQAVEPEPWPPAIWRFELVWHESLSADELAVLRERIDSHQEIMLRRGWVDRWIEANERGHVTLTWEYAEGAELLDWLGDIWQTSMSKRRVEYSISHDPIPGPPTLDAWRRVVALHRA